MVGYGDVRIDAQRIFLEVFACLIRVQRIVLIQETSLIVHIQVDEITGCLSAARQIKVVLLGGRRIAQQHILPVHIGMRIRTCTRAVQFQVGLTVQRLPAVVHQRLIQHGSPAV